MLAIIPARGGSKGLPGKNIKLLNNKPLIAYTIEAALKSKGVDKVIVSTDDEEIALVAKKYGADVPFMRPAELASDTAYAVDVYIHAVEYMMEKYSAKIDKFMVLLPTTPLRNENHIDEAIDLFYRENPDTLISMKEAETPISWYYRKDDNMRIRNAEFECVKGMFNRQENDVYYIPNGAIYILDYKLLKDKRSYYSNNTIPYIMNPENSVDIDNNMDFMYAEFLMKYIDLSK